MKKNGMRFSNKRGVIRSNALRVRQTYAHGNVLSPIEQQVLAQQSAAAAMTPEQRKKKQDDAETLKFLGIPK
jgi:hypothetical protein